MIQHNNSDYCAHKCCYDQVSASENSDFKIMLFVLILPLLLNIVNSYPQAFWYQPEQVHISYGENDYEIVVTWSTFNDTKESLVEYGIGGLLLTAQGSSKLFVDGGRAKHFQFIHRVKLTKLTPNSVYIYHCGSNAGWSSEFSFKTAPEIDGSVPWQPSLAIYGDLGNENAQSLARLQDETQKGMYDAILHVGDFAYDMHSHNGLVGDAFMRQIETIAAYVPYMTCPGNHEEKYNFSNYKKRFNMPGADEAMMYSFNMGPLHIISISTEVYYFINYGLKSMVYQYEWLEKDLKQANQPENRETQPWIIVMGHRPMYCSNTNPADCARNETLTRVGLPFFHIFGLEKLLYDYGVDLEIWAHEHSYERLWPIYDYKIYNGSYEEPYINPRAPIHVVTGSAGCKEDHSFFNGTKPYWSAFRSSDYGYTRLKAHNKTHLYLEQVSDDKDGAIIDSFWIVKNKHGFYNNLD